MTTVAILTTGIALAALIIGLWRDLKSDIKELRGEIKDVRGEMASIRAELHAIDVRLARLEGFMARELNGDGPRT